MTGRTPRIFVEAAERMIRETGMCTVRRYTGDFFDNDFDAVLVAPDIDAPAKVLPVFGGSVATSDLMPFLRATR